MVEAVATKAGSLRRGAAIMLAIARHAPNGAGLTDLVQDTGLPRATLHRVLDELIELEWVERSTDDRRFHLGLGAAHLGLGAAERHSIARRATVHLGMIASSIGEVVYLTERSGVDSICTAREEGSSRIQALVLRVGSREPLGLGAGSMALLAALDEEEAGRIVAFNMERYRQRPAFAESVFRDALSRARTVGAARHDGLFTKGVSGIGVAVRGPDGHPLAALSTAFIGDWFGARERGRFEERLRAASEAIARELSGGGGAQDGGRERLRSSGGKHVEV